MDEPRHGPAPSLPRVPRASTAIGGTGLWVEVGPGDRPGRGGIPAAPTLRDIRGAEVDQRRSITFQMGMGAMMGGGGGPMSFTFGGQEFDADRIDQQAHLDTVEEWIIGNDSPLDHPFHLHVWPMQGKTVYHCHILDHEDRGMMGTVLAR